MRKNEQTERKIEQEMSVKDKFLVILWRVSGGKKDDQGHTV